MNRLSRKMQDSFLQFSRNGKWGTCVDCPRDTNRNVYPEFCEHRDRYDHCLTIDQLVTSYKSEEAETK